jgi:hypothetical protein
MHRALPDKEFLARTGKFLYLFSDKDEVTAVLE